MEFLSKGKDGLLLLTIYVQPKASKNKIAGIHGEAIKLCITAPPVDGKANKAVTDFFAKFFHLAKSQVTLHSGQQSRTKRLQLTGITLNEAETLLNKVLA
ncbi:MAG: DUF167 domain-containing protein [Desulfobulbaceae bacterium]|nr:DUF167 domain-containing protein [Desulfobulbaceae bacterium]